MKITSYKIRFPLLMTVMSFVFFIIFYWWLNVASYEYMMLKGLIFAVPFITFSIITIISFNSKKSHKYDIITGIFIFLFVCAFIALLIYCVLESFSTVDYVTTNPRTYERILQKNDYPNKEIISKFPDKIPQNATNIKFSYIDGFGESYTLGFKSDKEYIENFVNKYKSSCQYYGSIKDNLQSYGFGSLPRCKYFDDNNIPDNYEVCVIDSKPYSKDCFNHGMKYGFLVSKERDTIIFFADRW